MSKLIGFGCGRRCINPTVPVSLAGYFNIRMWDKILDDLEVRALVLRSAEKEFLLVQFELITVTESLYLNITEILKTEFPQFGPNSILLTATHTHTAQNYRGGSGNGMNPACMPAIVSAAIEAIREACADKRQGELLSALTSDKRFEFNRRYWMKDGKVITNPGKLNPYIDRPEGKTDFDIPLLAIRSNGRIAVLLANIVNHSDTTGGCAVSADWPGFTHRILEKELGPGSMMMPLIGCAGNINHFDVSDSFDQTNPHEAERIGTGYAETISAALPSLKPLPDFEFKTFGTTVTAYPAEVSDAERIAAEETMAKYKDVPDAEKSGIDLTSEDLAKKAPVALKYFANQLLKAAQSKEVFHFHLAALDLGPVVIASLPAEPFVEIGFAVKNEVFPGKLCFVVSHGNGTGTVSNSGGYIPNLCNYGRGGYETEVRSNPFEHHLAEKLVAGWKEAVKNR